MAGGWARDGAVQDQIDASVEEEVRRARSRLGQGEARSECHECGQSIPEARRKAVPGARLCIACQQEFDAESRKSVRSDRRGSKDSQLR